jgi:hypothetical protein
MLVAAQSHIHHFTCKDLPRGQGIVYTRSGSDRNRRGLVVVVHGAAHTLPVIPEVQIDTITLRRTNLCMCARKWLARVSKTLYTYTYLTTGRLLREWDGSFDRIMSIGMVEAVGLEKHGRVLGCH